MSGNKIKIFILILMLVVSPQMLVFGYELDLSVNDEIEKKYDFENF